MIAGKQEQVPSSGPMVSDIRRGRSIWAGKRREGWCWGGDHWLLGVLDGAWWPLAVVPCRCLEKEVHTHDA